ncbi:MAG: hypothetical protein PHG05_02475 [Candidatus Nanoarchaeia archaeon]|nr:hypothetical protein [Candidatus Nanoarchaeia archaeon]
MIITANGRKIPFDETFEELIVKGGALWSLVTAFLEYKEKILIEAVSENVEEKDANDFSSERRDLIFITSLRGTNEGKRIRIKNALELLNIKSSVQFQEIDTQQLIKTLMNYIQRTHTLLEGISKVLCANPNQQKLL